MDISGETQRDISHNVVLNSKGKIVANSAISQLGSDLDKMSDVKQDNHCGPCYGGTERPSQAETDVLIHANLFSKHI